MTAIARSLWRHSHEILAGLAMTFAGALALAVFVALVASL